MSQPIPSNSTGLVLDYHFAEGPASVSLTDSTPFGNNGILFINGDFSRYNFPARIPSIAPSVSVPFSIRVEDGKGGIATQSFTVKTLPPLPRNIQGTVFDDVNGNGIKDGVNEAGLFGQIVFVDQNGNLQLDASEAKATTDASGNYSLAYVGTQANVVLVGKPGRIQSNPSLPSQLVDLSSGNASSVNFGTQVVADSKPLYISIAPTAASVPGEFRYQAYAQSTGGSTIQYGIAVAPIGASIDATSGLLRWTPKFSDAGPADFVLTATDGAGRVALQAFRVQVSVNTAPMITSTAPTTASQGVLYHYDIQAQDAEQAVLNFTFEQAPTGATIDAVTGKIRWTPSPTQLGNRTFIVVANDGKGRIDKQSFSVNVTLPSTNNSPVLTAGPRTSAQVGVTYRSSVSATDADNDLLTYTMLSGPANAAITNEGFISWTPTDLGPHSITVRVADNRGGNDEHSYTINVGASPVTGSVRFTSSPVSNAVVDRVYAYDTVALGAKQFQLLAAPIGMSIDPVLGRVRWRPTSEQLGLTTVRIEATDELGNTSEQSVALTVRRSDRLPSIISVPPTQIAVGSTYIYVVQADNPSGNPLVYSLSAAPLGMSINSQTGAMSWTPAASQIGSQSVILRVTDGTNNFLTQSFALQVTASSPNRQPLATSTPPQDATSATPLNYRFTAVDPDGDNLVYSVVSGPSGLSIDAATGVLTWTPTTAQIGTVAVTLKASDPLGAAAVQSFLIDVRGANRAPSIDSVASQTLAQGGLYRYDVIASDPDREPLLYELRSGPQGMTIDSLGRVRWQTALDTPLGQRQVSVRVTDGRGGSVVQDFNVNVVADTIAPRISILTSGMVLSPWNRGPSTVKVQAVDNVAVSSIQFFVDGQAVPLRDDGTADIYFTAPGNGRMLAYAFDPAGNRGSTTNNILMCSGEEECIPSGSVNQPQTMISNIADGDSVTGFVDIVGTASATDFESYELSYRRSDQTAYTTIKSSTTAVINSLIAKWDTTLLENDSYILRLEARDKFGGFSAIERTVGVSGNLKLGNFRLSFADLTIPVAGIPITLARTYDTLRADRSGDFGYGWRMEFRNTDLRTSLPKTGLEDQGIYSAFKANTKVYLTLPGGQREGFTFTPDIRVLPGFGGNLVIATPRFTPDRGVKNKLTAGSGNLLVNERGELYASGGIPWNPGSPDFSGYTLTTPDGIQYKIDGTGNLNAAIDLNGNTLSFSDSGIASSNSGIGIAFARDTKGRITRVIDPAGNSVKYTYDAKGDLANVIDRMGNVTKFTYRTDRPHYLDSVIDPLGRTGAKAVYGPDGRLTGTRDANGNGPTVSYDPDNSLVTTTDALGNKTISEYDSRGNVVSQIDATGGVIRTTYDLNNNITSTTDALGRKTTYTVDDSGNVTGTTDPLGHTRRATFDSYGNQLSSTDALGRTTKSEFDARGNLFATVDVTGAKTTTSSDSRGQLTSVTLVGGGQLSIGYTGALATSSTDLNGLASQFSFNANGLSTGRTITVSTASGPANATERTEYDADGRVIATTDASGATRRTEYDAAGQVIAEIDPRGRRTIYEYDSAGRRIRVTLPDGSSTQTAYDAAGRATSITDALGRTTRYQFDAIGRRIATVYADDTPLTLADNPRTQTVYNLAGEVIAQLDELGNRSEFEYDLNGQRVLVRDPLGFVTRTTYNETGAVVSVTDAFNRTSTILYDAFGRQIGARSPDGSTTSQTLNESGLPATKLDELGRTTSYSYTASGQLQQVTDALGNSIRYEYDTRGKLVKQTDANGHITRWEYDILGREVARILPGGQAWRTEYDDLSQVSKTIDPNGQATTFIYDEVGRLLTKATADGAVVQFKYTLSGQLSSVTDARGVTQFLYDVRDRLLSRTEPDGQAIRYTYDDAGRTLSMTTLGGTVRYGYDAASRLTSVTDPTGGITRYTFNAVGSLTRTDFSNSIVELREYDTNGRLTRKTATGPTGTLTDYRYTLDATGRAVSFTGDGETVQYTYDPVYRLTNEQATSGRNISFTYDAVGNRLTRTDNVGSTVYQYDVNDRLTRTTTGSTVTDYTYDDAGNQLRQQTGADHTDYTWDASNRMIRARVTKAGSTAIEDYNYDAGGNRVAVVNASGETRYLLDLNGQLSQVAAEYTPSGLLIATSIRGNGVIGETRNGGSSILLTDRLGSVRVVTGASGAELARFAYDAFGNIVASSGGAGTPLRFTGEPQSIITGLDYFRARSYDSTTGRFVSADPFIGLMADAFSRHRYQYGDMDPANKTDPSGLYRLDDLAAAQGVVNSLNTAKEVEVIKKEKDFAETVLGAVRLMQFVVSTGIGVLLSPFGTTSYKASGEFNPSLFGVFNSAGFSFGRSSSGNYTIGFSVGRNLDQSDSLDDEKNAKTAKDGGTVPSRISNASLGFSVSYDLTNQRLNGVSLGIDNSFTLASDKVLGAFTLWSIGLKGSLLSLGYTASMTTSNLASPMSFSLSVTALHVFNFSYELFPGPFIALGSAPK
ncbi:MAG: putative Ig domain-containing protein [Pirellulaceae bacterium]|nr:putative Ig domain-containing protein [Pirellulaceae bacterium]